MKVVAFNIVGHFEHFWKERNMITVWFIATRWAPWPQESWVMGVSDFGDTLPWAGDREQHILAGIFSFQSGIRGEHKEALIIPMNAESAE